MATLKDEMVKLKSQIVESPEELRSEMERMKENVKSIRMSKVCIVKHRLLFFPSLDQQMFVPGFIRSCKTCKKQHIWEIKF